MSSVSRTTRSQLKSSTRRRRRTVRSELLLKHCQVGVRNYPKSEGSTKRMLYPRSLAVEPRLPDTRKNFCAEVKDRIDARGKKLIISFENQAERIFRTRQRLEVIAVYSVGDHDGSHHRIADYKFRPSQGRHQQQLPDIPRGDKYAVSSPSYKPMSDIQSEIIPCSSHQ